MHLRLKMKFLGAILVHPVRRQILLAKCTLDSTTSETVSYAADAQQDFHMRINAHGSAYAHHPHEPHGSATAWPTLVRSVL